LPSMLRQSRCREQSVAAMPNLAVRGAKGTDAQREAMVPTGLKPLRLAA